MDPELNYVAGEWRATSRSFERQNPSKPEEIVGTYPVSRHEDFEAALGAADRAFAGWKKTPIVERGRILQRASRILAGRVDAIGRLIAREAGKPIGEAKAEAARAVDLLDYYAAYAWRPNGYSVPSARPETELSAVRVPVGVVAIITPWNFPIAIPAWKLAPALIMGNTVVLKPSGLAPGAAVELTRALDEAGLPPGVLNLLHGPGATFGEVLAGTELVRALSFTGSAGVGRKLKSELAGMMVKVQLELGSKNPFVVWRDADLDEAAGLAAEGAFFYAGQKCTATSRVLVHHEVYRPFRERFVAVVEQLAVGDPLDAATRVGPLIDQGSQRNVGHWVAQGRDGGGTLLTGGAAPERPGYFFMPTVMEGVELDAALAQTEVFGPLVTLHAVDSLEEAIAAANATPYGLSASIATRDLGVARRFMAEVDAGLLHVNQPTAGVEYQAPFGGAKKSGFGPKEQGESALDFYSDWRTRIVRI